MGEKNNLLKRLKKIAKQQGEVLLVDEKTGELFALSYLDDEGGDCCGADCDCGSVKTFEESDFVNEVKVGGDIDEVELMKRVNEDIAKWRAEEKNNIDNQAVLEETDEDIKDEISDNLMEEERYYLEPLE